MVSTAPLSQPLMGGTLLVDPNQSITGPNGGVLQLLYPATHTFFPVQMPVGLGGHTFYAQAGMLDLGQPGGIALTNGLEITVCP